MSYKVVPLDMISAPNFFAPKSDNRWEITNPNAVTLWLQLQISDALGDRRFMTGAGAVLQAVFQRSDLFAQSNNQLTQTARSLTKTAVVHAQDKSLFSVSLNAQDVQTLVSGTIKFSYTDIGISEVWVQDWLIKKTLTDPGF